MKFNYEALRQVIHAASVPSSVPPDYELDSVCLLLFDLGETMLLTIQKADVEGYHWANQIALPGGKIEPADVDARDAALRELQEELGVDRADVELLGSLGHFQTSTSPNDLEVIVGRWMRPSEVSADEREVARVLAVPIGQLLNLHQTQGLRSKAPESISSELEYPLADAKIWGVTARILHHFLEMVLDHEGTVILHQA